MKNPEFAAAVQAILDWDGRFLPEVDGDVRCISSGGSSAARS